MSLEQEIERCKADGMLEDDIELDSFETSGGKQSIRTIGTALVGEEKCKVNTMSDNGSTGSFVTHAQARRSRLKKKRITNLRIKTLTGFKSFKTFVYSLPVGNFKKKKLQEIEATGVSHIGRCKPLSTKHRSILDKILKPAGLSSDDLTNPTHGEVGILIGGDAASLQLFDHLQLNSLRKPLNLRFFSSDIMRKPLTYGEVGGEWHPEVEVTVNVEKHIEEEKETFSYNTAVYKLLEEQDNNEDKENNDWSE